MNALKGFFGILLVAPAAWAAGCSTANHDDFHERWLKIHVGIPLEEAEALLGSLYAYVGVTNADGGGYRKYWRGPNQSRPTEEFVYRTIIPFGDVYTLRFNMGGIVVNKSKSYVTEKEFQEHVQRYKDAKK